MYHNTDYFASLRHCVKNLKHRYWTSRAPKRPGLTATHIPTKMWCSKLLKKHVLLCTQIIVSDSDSCGGCLMEKRWCMRVTSGQIDTSWRMEAQSVNTFLRSTAHIGLWLPGCWQHMWHFSFMESPGQSHCCRLCFKHTDSVQICRENQTRSLRRPHTKQWFCQMD